MGKYNFIFNPFGPRNRFYNKDISLKWYENMKGLNYIFYNIYINKWIYIIGCFDL